MRIPICSLIFTIVTLQSVVVQATPGANWNFDQYDGDARRIQAVTGGAEIVISEGWPETGLSNPKGSTLTTGDDQAGGTALGLSGMARNGQSFDVILPAREAATMALSADLRRSGSGFTAVILSISTDGGITFSELEAWAPVETWTVHSATVLIPQQAQPIVLRFTLDGATSARGIVRFDNLRVFDSVASMPAEKGSPSHSD